jgi:hypothetical protein
MPARPTVPTPADLIALEAVLEPGEQVARTVAGVGAGLVLTDRRLHLIRGGGIQRPKSGIRSWPLDADLKLQLGPSGRDAKWLTIASKGPSVTVFLVGSNQSDLDALVADVRSRSRTR